MARPRRKPPASRAAKRPPIRVRPPDTERSRPEAEIRRIREARIRAYIAKRSAIAKRKDLAKEPGILAEGDSWFEYPKSLMTGGSIIDHLQGKIDGTILNLAHHGDDVRLMLSLPQREEITRRLSDGIPKENRPFDVLLFSGGGNDLVGNQFCIWLKPFVPGTPASNVIDSARFDAVLAIVEAGYEDLIAIRDSESPGTRIYFHSYDFAIPDGRPVCGVGPWLRPSLVFRGVPPEIQRDVVKDMLIRFDRRIRRLADAHPKVQLVATQGTLADNEWSNEIHPDRIGFDKLADRFAVALKTDFPIL